MHQVPTNKPIIQQMKRILLLLVLSFYLAGAKAQETGSSLLWEISGKELQQPSYLFGTFHIVCREDFSISPLLETKIKACRQFYGELNMDDPTLQLKLMQLVGLQNTTLQQLLPQNEYPKISEAFKQITGLPLQLFDHTKPFLCISMLVQKSISCTEQVQPETLFTQLAKTMQLKIGGLESAEEQMAAIDREPLDSQALSFSKMALHFDSVKNVMREMSRVYQKRNTDSLYAFMKSKGLDGDFETILLQRRNEKWIPRIEALMRSAPAFIAVGAGHLGGANGLIALLRKNGYIIRPVRY